MIYSPVGNSVLLVMDKPPTMVGGFYMPETSKSGENKGKVVALGTGEIRDGKQIPWKVKVGDRVVTKNTLENITLVFGEVTYVVYRQEEIIGVIEE